MNAMNASTWYRELIRPEWAPPAWVFGPVWSVLYLIIAVTFGYVAYLYFVKGSVPFLVVLPFILNLLFNFAFTPLQFGLQNNLINIALSLPLVLAGTLVSSIGLSPVLALLAILALIAALIERPWQRC